jgi:hypothetical protein
MEASEMTRDEEDQWEDAPEDVVIERPVSVVYSVRFDPTELEEIRREARRRGITLSELIRTSVMTHIRESHEPNVDVAAPRALRIQFYQHTPAPRIRTVKRAVTPLNHGLDREA